MFKKLIEEVEKKRGGLSDEMTVEQIAEKHGVSVESIKAQIEKGKKVEMEHTDSPEEAAKVAMDHLVEFPDYYDRLDKMEEEAKKELNEAMLLLTESEKEEKIELEKAKDFLDGKKVDGVDTNKFVRIWNHIRDNYKMDIHKFAKLLNPMVWPKAIFLGFHNLLRSFATLGTKEHADARKDILKFMSDIGDGKYRGKSAKEMFADYNAIRKEHGFKPYSYLQEDVIRTDFNGVPNRDFDGNIIDEELEKDFVELNEAVATAAQLLKKARQIEVKIRTEKEPEKLRVLTQQLEAIKKVLNDPNLSNATISVKGGQVVDK